MNEDVSSFVISEPSGFSIETYLRLSNSKVEKTALKNGGDQASGRGEGQKNLLLNNADHQFLRHSRVQKTRNKAATGESKSLCVFVQHLLFFSWS
ncbi:hypothetical protein [Solemya velum gill symbiont]|uniref:hypothetical protein n=1 Tax=Solemya velum gill symbiont TaxID=2340 RepID=UPI000997AFEC|nr:hypothetical protein [Solemya velum gill symbiont]OOY36407.1 hypothetical protein BOV89_12730 [Solemya velum gill symbiont]OOY49032.1 hypothetical protein BOV94_12765 [Solemya velum gill symbiont]